MRRSRFSEEQIIAILAEQERGLSTAEVCRRHGVSSATFYKWKARYGGLDVLDVRRLKTLETENVLALVADTSISGQRVARELDRITRLYGRPATIVSDNSAELTSRASSNGRTRPALPGTISRRASRSRTVSSRASMHGSGMSY